MQRQNSASLNRLSRVLWLGLLVVMFVTLLEPAAADQTVSCPHPVTFTARDDMGHTSAAMLTVIVQ